MPNLFFVRSAGGGRVSKQVLSSLEFIFIFCFSFLLLHLLVHLPRSHPVTALHKGAPGQWPGWKIHRPVSSPGSLPSPPHCFASVIVWTQYNKKLISRWDSERELSLRRHRTRSTNTICSCINSATDRRVGYVLERMFTKFSEITQCNGHYAVQGHSRSSILVPIESSYTTSY